MQLQATRNEYCISPSAAPAAGAPINGIVQSSNLLANETPSCPKGIDILHIDRELGSGPVPGPKHGRTVIFGMGPGPGPKSLRLCKEFHACVVCLLTPKQNDSESQPWLHNSMAVCVIGVR